MTYDTIVVGAGPAGAASAILLAERGLEVLVVDRARFPRPKLCGEYLSPEAARILDRLGVLKAVDDAGAAHLRGMRITAPDGTMVVGTYRALGPWRPYRDHAMGLSRSVLDAILVDRVRALPIDFREAVHVRDVVRESGRVVGVEAEDGEQRPCTFRAPVVIAADGRASVVAHRLGSRHPHRLRRMALVTYVSGLSDAGGLGEIFVDPPDYAILNPLAPDVVNMSLVVPLAHVAPWTSRLEDFFGARLRQLPHLARRVDGAQREAPVQAMGPLAYRVEPPPVGGVLYVGDAAGFYDPFTGEGIFTALRSAELAVETLMTARRLRDWSVRTLAAYERARRAAFADKSRVTRVLQVVIRHRRLANVAARLLGRRPQLLDRLMGVIGDFVPPRALLFPPSAR